MTSRQFDQVVVDQCSHCQGVWLDPGELTELQAIQAVHFSQSTASTPIHDVITGPCPRCGGPDHMVRLTSRAYPGVVIDSCASCFGIWLDGGELSRLAQPAYGTGLLDLLRRLIE